MLQGEAPNRCGLLIVYQLQGKQQRSTNNTSWDAACCMQDRQLANNTSKAASQPSFSNTTEMQSSAACNQ
jgi:hypothetical protein